MKGLANKRIVVTGASSGIGWAIAERLSEEQSTLLLIGRHRERLAQIASRLEAQSIVADLSSTTDVATLLDGLKASGEQFSGWVLAAGEHDLRPIMMESPESLEHTWRANVSVALSLLAGALKRRLVAKGASILFLGSTAARVGGSGQVAYSASKAALIGATKSLAVELAPQSIRVNALSPGLVQTPMSARNLARLTPLQIESLRSRHLLGFGEPNDIAGPAAFLLSDEAKWITGSELIVDGGFSAG